MLTANERNLFGDIFAGLVSLYNGNYSKLDYTTLMTRYNLTAKQIDKVVSKVNGKW